MKNKNILALLAILTIGSFTSVKFAASNEAPDITVPSDFRTTYEFLGAWAVKSDTDDGENLGQHVVYASPGSVAAFRKTGLFPDGTVLVKELFKGKTEQLSTGEASHATTVAGYFVMIKDAKGSNTGPLWGDGWGWAFFNPDNTQKTTSTNYKTDCLGCHEPVRDQDLIFSYGYPVLQKSN